MKLRLVSIFLVTAAVALSPAGSQVASSASSPAATAPPATTTPDAGRLAIARQYVALVRPNGGNSVEDMRAGVLSSSMRLLGDNPSDQERADLK